MTFSKKDIIDKVREALKNPATLYQADFVNYIGNIDDKWYTEIAAREILKRIKTDNLSAFRNGI